MGAWVADSHGRVDDSLDVFNQVDRTPVLGQAIPVEVHQIRRNPTTDGGEDFLCGQFQQFRGGTDDRYCVFIGVRFCRAIGFPIDTCFRRQ